MPPTLDELTFSPVLRCWCGGLQCSVCRTHVCEHAQAAILEGPEYIAALPERREWPTIPEPVHHGAT